MAKPTPYKRGYSFSNYQQDVPDKPLPGPNVDIELDNIAQRSKELTDLVNAGFDIEINSDDVAKVAAEIDKVVFVADNMDEIRDANEYGPDISRAVDLFLGAYASDPSTGHGGDPLVIGATYYNTTISESRVWNGSFWLPVAKVSLGGVLQGSLTVGPGETTFFLGDYVSVSVALNGATLTPGVGYELASPNVIVPDAQEGDTLVYYGVLKGSETDAASFVRQTFLTTAGERRYAFNSAGAPLAVTQTNHIMFGGSPFGPLTYGVDYTVEDGGVDLSYDPEAGELYTLFSMPRFTNSEAQAVLQAYKDEVEVFAVRAEEAAEAAEAVAWRQPFTIITVSGQQTYPLPYDPGEDKLDAQLNGLGLEWGYDYTLSGASITLLAPVVQGGSRLVGSAARDLPTLTDLSRVMSFADRDALVAYIGVHGAKYGYTYFAGGLTYGVVPVGHVLHDVIPDLPGIIPAGKTTPEHFGNIDGVDDQAQINAAILYQYAAGGGDVYAPGQYVVSPSGEWSTVNGDLNACVRLEGLNTVRLIGEPGKSKITQTGNKIAHIVSFGRRVGISISSRGGISGFEIWGNLDTAVSEGVPFEGGTGINVSGPGLGVHVTLNVIRKAYNYGIGFQRSWFQGCRVECNDIDETGSDGIDCKFDYLGDITPDGPDTPEEGYADNWIKFNRVTRPAQKWATLVGQKAAIDYRIGWNTQGNIVEIDTPCVGVRCITDDEAISPPPSSDTPNMRYLPSSANDAVISTGVKTGLDAGGATIEAFGFQFGVWRGQFSNLQASGAVRNYWIRGDKCRFYGLLGRNATNNNLAIYGTAGFGVNGHEFYGIDMSGGVAADVRIYGTPGNIPANNKFFGGECGTFVIDAGAVNTEMYGVDYTTLTDAGTNTLRLRAGDPAPLNIGRNAAQYLTLTGDGGGNYIRSIGLDKALVIDNQSNGDINLNAPTGKAVNFRVNNVSQGGFDVTGLRLSTGKALYIGGVQILTSKRHGWVAPTGTSSRATFDTSTATTAELAQRLKALIEDLTAHGIIGA